MAVAGDVAGLCANEGVAISTANRIVINDVKVFMMRILPVTRRSWQATIRPIPLFGLVQNRLQDDATIANDKRVHAEIDRSVC